jgi:hypothetical protein
MGSVDGVTLITTDTKPRDQEGRWLTEADNLQRRNVIVIGVSCREALFPNPDESPIGKVVRMNGDT